MLEAEYKIIWFIESLLSMSLATQSGGDELLITHAWERMSLRDTFLGAFTGNDTPTIYFFP